MFHVGSARTALFNWLYARHTGGAFILRVEDTDAARNKAEYVDVILQGLQWLGMNWDEGPQLGGGVKGDRGPYFQSQRGEFYKRAVDQLMSENKAYESDGAIRFRMPKTPATVHDLICGDIQFDRTNEPDLVIQRKDGSPVFHLVNVVDDMEMGITHVIRGEDHLSNTQKHLALIEALGGTAPHYAHIPLILNPNGSKMSKVSAPCGHARRCSAFRYTVSNSPISSHRLILETLSFSYHLAPTMADGRSYPSPNAAATRSAGPFYGNGDLSSPGPEVRLDQELQDELDAAINPELQNQGSDATNAGAANHPHQQLAQSVMSLAQHPQTPGGFQQPQHPSSYHQATPGGFQQTDQQLARPGTPNSLGGDVTQSGKPRSKVSRACDECRRKKVSLPSFELPLSTLLHF